MSGALPAASPVAARRPLPTAPACHFCQLPLPVARHDPGEPAYCCYGCELAERITRARGEEGRVNWMLTRLGLSAFLSMSVMMFSMYLYRQHYVDEASATPLSRELAGVMRYLCLLFSTPVFFMLGWPILASAGQSARRGVYSTDALVVLGVAATLALSYVSTLRGAGPVYYETGCVVLVFMTLGRWLEASGRLRSSSALASLEALLPDRVAVQRDGEERLLRPEEVLPGDILTIAAGQRIAADGLILSGRANLDESLLTGEPLPAVREPGDAVRAGTQNMDGVLTIQATTAGTLSTLSRLIELLQDARRSRGRLERLTERVSRVFVPLTLLLALLGFALSIGAGLDRAILSALSVMLIACPCALGIATPMAVWIALGRSAGRGILFRSGEAIESLARVRAVCFDKTGTLTTGGAVVVRVTTETGADVDGPSIVAAAAGIARASSHAFSLGLQRMAAGRAVEPGEVDDIRTLPGRGLAGRWRGRRIVLGNLPLMEEEGLSCGPSLAAVVRDAAGKGAAFACIGWGGAVRGVFQFAETIRPEATSALEALARMRQVIRVLTGDHRARASAIARELGVEVCGDLTPAGKIERLRSLRREVGPVAMVGDGLNDAPALAAADVGIALGCGADITRENAAVCLLGNHLGDVPWALAMARRTVSTIRRNLFWAFAYNVVGIGLALTGRLNPIFAAAAMILSSLFVLASSLRLAVADSPARTDGVSAPGRLPEPRGPAAPAGRALGAVA
jgi:heavy metal translocating P-type ATPase